MTDKAGPNYNEFMRLVMAYGAAKAAYVAIKASGKYELRKEDRLKRHANAAFEKVADAAARRFPGGKDYAEPGVTDEQPAKEVIDWGRQPKRLKDYVQLWSWFMTAFRLADLINHGYIDLAQDLASKIPVGTFPDDPAPLQTTAEKAQGRTLMLAPFEDPWLDEAEKRLKAEKAERKST